MSKQFYRQLTILTLLLIVMNILFVVSCSSTRSGRSSISSHEPSSLSPQVIPPSMTPSPTSSSSPHPSSPHPSSAIPLPVSQNGYVFIATKSGKTRCQITTEMVGCEAEFLNSPLREGEHANGVSVRVDGKVQWILGNLGDIPTTTIDYHTYSANGWTIIATQQGTRFTNDLSGHGMFVSIERVETF